MSWGDLVTAIASGIVLGRLLSFTGSVVWHAIAKVALERSPGLRRLVAGEIRKDRQLAGAIGLEKR